MPENTGDPVYEMLWDCKFCGTKKLLGLTHRHCPVCGAPQNAEERYFPPDSEKVPVQSHEYFGADVTCAHCGVANSSHSKHCGGCGAPLDGGKAVARRQDQVVAGGESFAGQTAADARRERRGEPAPAPPRRTSAAKAVGIGCLAVVVLVVVLVSVGFLWKREGGFEVTGHRWKRDVVVERFGPVQDSDWCDSMPGDARGVSRRREVRSHEKVADGEDCHVRKVDNGNGTFTEHQECTTRYRDEPVYADRCSYTVDRWKSVRTATAEGASLADPLRWPDPALTRTGTCVGCEREGSRKEEYVVLLRDEKGGEQTCEFDQRKWGSFAVKSRWKGAVRVMTGGLDCDSLTAQ